MAKESYPELINYVSFKTGISYHRTWKILKEYSKVLKDSIKRGDNILIDGVLEITYTTKEGYIYNNKTSDLTLQIKHVSLNLGFDELEVRNTIITYLRRLTDRVADGYQVNIKGVCYLIPSEEFNVTQCKPRVSPVLKKPDTADYVISTETGNLIFKEVLGENLRFKIDISDELELPTQVMEEEQAKKLDLKQIDI